MTTNPAYGKRYNYDRARGLPPRTMPAHRVDLTHVRALAAEFSPVAVARAAGLSDYGLRGHLDGAWPTIRRSTARRLTTVTRAAVYAACGDNDWVPTVGYERRRRALAAIGWDTRSLRRHGIDAVRPSAHVIAAKSWRRMRDVYDTLWNQPGPSRRAANAAARNGWAPPLAWDEDTIDDPAARPGGLVGAMQTARDRLIEDVTELLTDGVTVAEACARLGRQPGALARSLQRAGRHDLWHRLQGRHVPAALEDSDVEGVSA